LFFCLFFNLITSALLSVRKHYLFLKPGVKIRNGGRVKDKGFKSRRRAWRLRLGFKNGGCRGQADLKAGMSAPHAWAPHYQHPHHHSRRSPKHSVVASSLLPPMPTPPGTGPWDGRINHAVM
jgi:hypothetical protein